MKRLLAAVACLLALCACGQAQPEETTSITTVPQTTTEAPTTTQLPTLPAIEYPDSYKDAPKEYKPILDDLYKFVYVLVNDILIDENELFGETGFADAPSYAFSFGAFQHGYVGYAIQDINSDGVPELLLLNKEETILSFFTLKDNKPVHLGGYARRVYCRGIAADGTIHTGGSSSAASGVNEIYKLEPHAAELTFVVRHDYDYWPPEEVDTYHKEVDGVGEDITEEDYKAIAKKYADPEKSPMKLNFISIEQ